MSDEKIRTAFICYLDENNEKREGYFELIKFDASFIKFKTTNGSVITLPTIRLLKMKEKGEFENE